MKVFSFCLYGPYTRKYYQGLLENLDIIRREFPDWHAIVYVGTDVPESFRNTLRSHSFCVVVPVSTTGHTLMLHRFCAIDHPDVEIMCVRDADSRIHSRDQWTIREFLRSQYMVHIIRDHRFHTIPIVGGMWGMKRGALPTTMQSLMASHFTSPAKFNDDQLFLQNIVYPIVKDRALVHSSNSFRASAEETIMRIPFRVVRKEFIGQVVEYLPPLFIPIQKCDL